MSMLSFAHHFCDLNDLSIAEFCRLFTADKPREKTRCTELLHSDKSSLDAANIRQVFGPADSDPEGLFAAEFGVTSVPAEMHTSLRVCRSCLTSGFHFAYHQLSWLEKCPIHDELLVDGCGCKRRNPFALNRSRRPARQLCACGEVALGEPDGFTSEELARHYAFLRQLQLLRSNLRTPLGCLRIDDNRGPDKTEILQTYRLLRHVITGMTMFDTYIAVEPPVLGCPLHFLNGDSDEALDELFEQFFVNLTAGRFSNPMSAREASAAVAFLERHLLGSDVGCPARTMFKFNASKDPLDEEFVGLSKIVTTIRALDAIESGRLPLDGYRRPDFRSFVEALGRPVALLYLPAGKPHVARAFWLSKSAHDCPAPEPWIDDFARFYLKHVTIERYTANAVEKRLKEAEADRDRRLQFARPSGQSANDAQYDLFGTLGDRRIEKRSA